MLIREVFLGNIGEQEIASNFPEKLSEWGTGFT
jgi:hypothetical protein